MARPVMGGVDRLGAAGAVPIQTVNRHPVLHTVVEHPYRSRRMKVEPGGRDPVRAGCGFVPLGRRVQSYNAAE